jgi:MSHA pilin protein MshD
MTYLSNTARRGITMAETIVSTLLVGMVLVGTIQLVGPIIRSGSVMSDKLVATNLARELSEEIATKYFTSPLLDDVEAMGAAVGETRSTYDDIDDYHGVNNSPPQMSNETVMTHLAGWSRSVKVVHVDLNDPSAESGSYTGLKRVTVTVTKDGVTLAQDITLHAHAADQLGFVMQEP